MARLNREQDSGQALAVSNHPGGARAMLPVVERMLDRMPELSFDLWLTEHSFALADLAMTRTRKRLLDEGIVDEELDSLDFHEYRFVLTGTSISGNLEPAVIRRARLQSVPVFSILDYWSDYGRRFGAREGTFTALPDIVFVPSEIARDDLLKQGVPASRLVLSGNPALDHLATSRARFSDRIREEVLEAFEVLDPPGFVLFVSEPISTDHPDRARDCSEVSVLQFILATLRRVPAALRPCLVVKAHPREDPAKFDAIFGEFTELHAKVAPASFNRHDLAMASNATLGIESTMLIETAMLGVATYSIQRGHCDNGSIRAGAESIAVIRDAATLGSVLQDPRHPLRPLPGSGSDASQVIVDKVGAYLASR